MNNGATPWKGRRAARRLGADGRKRTGHEGLAVIAAKLDPAG
jgi:hypothetical protein